MAFKLAYRPRAHEDLEAIYRFIAQDSPTRAYNFVERIQRRCELLSDSPQQGRARPDLGPDLRVVPYGRSVVIAYRIVENTVQVLRVLYGGRDYETIMSDDRDAH
jgi:toxin ParE1/3/4